MNAEEIRDSLRRILASRDCNVEGLADRLFDFVDARVQEAEKPAMQIAAFPEGSATPRTDSISPVIVGVSCFVPLNFARSLEREIVEISAQLEDAKADSARLNWLEQRTDAEEIVALVDKWKWHGVRYSSGIRKAIDAGMIPKPTESVPDQIMREQRENEGREDEP